MIYPHKWHEANGDLTGLAKTLKHRLPAGLKHPNLRLLPRNGVAEMLLGRLADEFPFHILDLDLPATNGSGKSVDGM